MRPAAPPAGAAFTDHRLRRGGGHRHRGHLRPDALPGVGGGGAGPRRRHRPRCRHPPAGETLGRGDGGSGGTGSRPPGRAGGAGRGCRFGRRHRSGRPAVHFPNLPCCRDGRTAAAVSVLRRPARPGGGQRGAGAHRFSDRLHPEQPAFWRLHGQDGDRRRRLLLDLRVPALPALRGRPSGRAIGPARPCLHEATVAAHRPRVLGRPLRRCLRPAHRLHPRRGTGGRLLRVPADLFPPLRAWRHRARRGRSAWR